jgi:hypothetical protein
VGAIYAGCRLYGEELDEFAVVYGLHKVDPVFGIVSVPLDMHKLDKLAKICYNSLC